MIAPAVAVMLWNQIGPGPLDVFIGAVKSRTGLPLTFAVWLTIAMMLAVAWALGRRPGAGASSARSWSWPVMQVTLEHLQVYEPPSSPRSVSSSTSPPSSSSGSAPVP
ncbi:MAG: hypothetical protein R2697_00230 [Ilumatobacteraceae bacterium]